MIKGIFLVTTMLTATSVSASGICDLLDINTNWAPKTILRNISKLDASSGHDDRVSGITIKVSPITLENDAGLSSHVSKATFTELARARCLSPDQIGRTIRSVISRSKKAKIIAASSKSKIMDAINHIESFGPGNIDSSTINIFKQRSINYLVHIEPTLSLERDGALVDLEVELNMEIIAVETGEEVSPRPPTFAEFDASDDYEDNQKLYVSIVGTNKRPKCGGGNVCESLKMQVTPRVTPICLTSSSGFISDFDDYDIENKFIASPSVRCVAPSMKITFDQMVAVSMVGEKGYPPRRHIYSAKARCFVLERYDDVDDSNVCSKSY